jgi:predicted enzyme related to lactoylglutathione lyase
MTTTTASFVWFDYVTPDVAKAQGFFGELFNWKTQQIPLPHGTYTMIMLGDQGIGGYTPTPAGAPPIGHWVSSLRVEDAAASCEKITSLGGKVLKPPSKVGEFGIDAIVADPQGGVFALFQPANPTSGDYKDVPGAWCWNELASHDPVKAVGFYTQLGFTEEKMEMGEMGTYYVLNSGGKPRAGAMKTPMPDAPQAWMPYVQVTSVDDVVAKAAKLGAQITLPPSDVTGVGRLAIFTDPQGGWLGVLAPAKPA